MADKIYSTPKNQPVDSLIAVTVDSTVVTVTSEIEKEIPTNRDKKI